MWCIPKITQEYIARMNELLDLYELPYNPAEPIIGLDEKSKQLLEHSRKPIPLTPGYGIREDSEYIRKGTCNLFVAVEPKGNKRIIKVTSHRTKQDFACFAKELVENEYNQSRKVHLVVDNLNTHFEKSFYETFEPDEADKILEKIAFHYTPKHGSWLNVAEIEISILQRQCLNRRIPDEDILRSEVSVWAADRNMQKKGIEWSFTKEKAAAKFKLNTQQN